MNAIWEVYNACDWGGLGEAITARNKRARELRLAGWKVKCYTMNFQDLARDSSAFLQATKGYIPSVWQGLVIRLKETN